MKPTLLPITVLLLVLLLLAATTTATATNRTEETQPPTRECRAYTVPVVCLHGLNCSADDCADLGALLAREHAGQPFYALAVDEGGASFGNLFDQLAHVRDAVRALVRAHPAEFARGFHFVGHSQGGLLARAVIEESDDLTVLNFLSLAGVQAGQFATRSPHFPLSLLVFTCVWLVGDGGKTGTASAATTWGT